MSVLNAKEELNKGYILDFKKLFIWAGATMVAWVLATIALTAYYPEPSGFVRVAVLWAVSAVPFVVMMSFFGKSERFSWLAHGLLVFVIGNLGMLSVLGGAVSLGDILMFEDYYLTSGLIIGSGLGMLFLMQWWLANDFKISFGGTTRLWVNRH